MVEVPLLEETLFSKDMEDDSSDETLSLCDLPLYSNQGAEDCNSSMSSSSSSSQQDDYFEFFSQDLAAAAAATTPPENIIFCGKLIQPPSPSSEAAVIKKRFGLGMFRWILGWGKSGSKNDIRSTTGEHKNANLVSKRYTSKKQGKKLDLGLHKMPILTTTSSGKARWYFLLFGISRFSTEVDLRDMKNRQSRRQPSELPPSMLKGRSEDESLRNGSSGAWGLIRVLSCGGNQHADAMVVASTVRCYNSRE